MLSGIGAYHDVVNTVLATDPIAFWPLWEGTGATAACLINPAQNGTYTGVTLGDTLTPWGEQAPFWDGATDFCSIHSATLETAFNDDEGSAAIWAQVFNAGVWTDGVTRRALQIRDSGANQLFFTKVVANDTLTFSYTAKDIAKNPISTTSWMFLGMSWSLSANEVKYFYNGAQEGATQIYAGGWTGSTPTRWNIGCFDNSIPNLIWHGWLAGVTLWDTVQAEATLLSIYNTGTP